MKRNHIRKLVYLVIFPILIISVISLSILHKYHQDLPSIAKLENYIPNLITKIYDINGKPIDEFYIEKRTLVPISKIPKNMINALIAIEDDNYYSHWGISISGIIRAFISNIAAGKYVQGGSTLTQQLAKQIFLTPKKTIKRKIKELLLALQLEYNYSKEEILQLYLNQIYFGHGAYGIASAARVYFKKSIEELTLEECALLAALPKAPSYFSPFRNSIKSMYRRNHVIKQMLKKKFITAYEAREAMLAPSGVIAQIPKKKTAPYFVEHIRRKLEEKYGNMLYVGGLKIYTTLDLDMQKHAESVLKEHLERFDNEKIEYITTSLKTNLKRDTTFYNTVLMYLKEDTTSYNIVRELKNSYCSDFRNIITISSSTALSALENYLADDLRIVEGALISLDPKTGQIRAMVGGRDFKLSQFNRVVQAYRQPGSSFKPCIYTAAIDNGWRATEFLNDSPVVYYNDGIDWKLIGSTTDYSDIDPMIKDKIDFEDPEKLWTPKNYSNRYRGRITLRTALQYSINVCAIELLSKVGPKVAVKYAHRLGIKSRILPYLSAALGSFVVTPLEMVTVFSTIANYGVRTEPYSVIKIYDQNNQLVENNFPREHEAISAKTAFIMIHLLKGVVERGTGMYARRLKRVACGKTGTTNNFSDTWFMGFTPQLVTGVWVGYDNCATLGKRRSGGNTACPIWTDYMIKALEDKPELEFSPPPQVVFRSIDPKTGLLAMSDTEKSYIEAFIKGTEPYEYSYITNLKKEDIINEKQDLINSNVNHLKENVTTYFEIEISTEIETEVEIATGTTSLRNDSLLDPRGLSEDDVLLESEDDDLFEVEIATEQSSSQ